MCYGQTDVPIRDTFPAEAAKVRERLKGYKFDKVFTSPLSRCVRLAEACGFPQAERDLQLMEMNFGNWEMRRYDEIDDPRLQEWYDNFYTVAPTGGESSEQQCSRFLQFIEVLRHSDYHSVCAFTHGGIMIHALTQLTGLSLPEALRKQPAYGEILEFEI